MLSRLMGRDNRPKYPVENILGEKTILRKLKREDLIKSLNWLKDPSINMFLSQEFRGLTEEQEIKWYDYIQSSSRDLVFAILDRDSNQYIGNCALHKIDLKKKYCELGIVIGERDYWSRGFGPDAINSILGFATASLKLKTIRLNVYKYNRRAIKAYKKCGFRLIRILRKDHLYDGKYWDTLVMEYQNKKT
jgi:RimJ/RimL family protein N-acetyltransferase